MNETAANATTQAALTLELAYNDGGTETITVEVSGKLPTPHRSERLMLTRLIGFKQKAFAQVIDLTLEDALANPEEATGLHPVFETTEDFPTTVLGAVTSFAAAA